MTPLVRVATFATAGLALLLGGTGVAYYLARLPAETDPARSRVAASPTTPVSLPGDRMLPDTEGAYNLSERNNRAEAERKPGAGASVPPLDTLNPTDPTPLSTAIPPHPVAVWDRQRREREKQQEQTQDQAVKAKAQGMAKVLAAWGGQHVTVDAPLKAPEPGRNETPAVAVQDPLGHLAVDRVYYGLLRVFVSSDEPGPVVVSLKDGELKGARLIGNFKRAEEKVVIHFDRMTWQGAWYTVDAYAVDPATGRLGLATDVDRRTFTRWAALLGSAVLQGAQRAYLSQGTQSTYLWGETSTHDYSDPDMLGIALGEIGTRTRRMATDYFNRPPTVSVDPALQVVGVLFMGPPSRKTPERPATATVGPQPEPHATVESGLLRAVTATRGNPSTDPAEDTRNYTRPTGGLLTVPAAQPTSNDD